VKYRDVPAVNEVTELYDHLLERPACSLDERVQL